MKFELLSLLLLLVLASILACVIFGLSYFFSLKKIDLEKVSAYECGFNPFQDARSKFDIRFYLIAILFLIFDLEISLLFPWVVALNDITLFGYWTMFIFLVILTIGFIYEWCKGALEW